MLNEMHQSDKVLAGAMSGYLCGRRMESPLAGLPDFRSGTGSAPEFNGVALDERAGLDLVTFRGNAIDATFCAAIYRAFGCEIPVEANTVREGKDYRLIWLGPDEWLAQSKGPQRSSIEEQVAASFIGVFASVVDVSSGFTTLTISGPNAAEVLARGCPLDLHTSVFSLGQCAQSHFFKASILILVTGVDKFELVVRRSFAEYVALMLLDAANSTLSSNSSIRGRESGQ